MNSHPHKRRAYGGLALALLALLWSLPVAAPVVLPSVNAQDRNDPVSAAKPKEGADADASAEESNQPPGIGAMFPIGREFLGVKIPSYSGDILSSVVTAVTMVRVDDEHMDMRTLKITLFGGPQEDDTYITTDRGVYDMKNETLTSRSKAFIERVSQFDMEGDRLIFDGRTQQGRLVGNVKMKIYKGGESFSKP